MYNFYSELQRRHDKYKMLYNKRPRVAAFKLLIWDLKQLFKIIPKAKKIEDSSNLNICFVLNGGIGDILLAANYIYNLKKFIECENINIDVFSNQNKKIINAIFKNNSIISNFYSEDKLEKHMDNYDYVSNILLYSETLKAHYKKIKREAPKLYEIIIANDNFKLENPLIFSFKIHDVTRAYLHTIALNKKRVQLPDVNGLLNLEPIITLPLTTENENNVLNKFSLADKIYITINRGVDVNNKSSESTKMWPLKYYERLLTLIKQRYPNITLVQLGANLERCKEINGIDVSLIGKTDLEDVKVLLKNSILHIDCEGGFVHLRNALTQKPSAVLFTSTDMRLLSYENNFNLKAENACNISCEWVIEDWQSKCLRGFENPPCSAKLKPEYVFEKIKDYLQENYIDN